MIIFKKLKKKKANFIIEFNLFTEFYLSISQHKQ